MTNKLLLFAGLGLAGISCTKQQKPNIIFLLTDDQTYMALSYYGNDQVKTPNMDKLAEEGVAFNHHYAATSICMASRAILMTGMY